MNDNSIVVFGGDDDDSADVAVSGEVNFLPLFLLIITAGTVALMIISITPAIGRKMRQTFRLWLLRHLILYKVFLRSI